MIGLETELGEKLYKLIIIQLIFIKDRCFW